MTSPEARDFLARVFGALFDPQVSAEEVGRYFAPGYVQSVDGKMLDRGDFIRHAQALKSGMERGSVRFEKVIADGTAVATHHVVSIHKKTGGLVEARVLAFFEIDHGLIQRTEELTYVLQGDASDRDLGSRV